MTHAKNTVGVESNICMYITFLGFLFQIFQNSVDLLSIFLVSCIEERPWWPIQSSNKGRKKRRKQKAKRREKFDQVYWSSI